MGETSQDDISADLSRLHEPMSLQEMRGIIRYRMGWKSLRNYLEAVEVTKRITIIKRQRGQKRTRYLVTLAALREHAAEIVPPALRDQSSKPNNRADLRKFRELLRKNEAKMAEVARNVIAKRVEPTLERHAQRLRKLENCQENQQKSFNFSESF